MTDTNGKQQPQLPATLPAAAIAELEDELRAAMAEANENSASEQAPEWPNGLDPQIASDNAGHAVHKCLQAADHIRSMGEQFLAIAQTVKATGDALALDIENRAANFDAMMKVAREYAQTTHGIFEAERAKLGGLSLTG